MNMRAKTLQTMLASVLSVGLLGAGARMPASCAFESAAEQLAGFPSQDSTVEETVNLIQHGDYTLALARLGTDANKDASMSRQARIFSAYVLLMAGNSLGAFPQKNCRG